MNTTILQAQRQLQEKDLAIYNIEMERARKSPVAAYLLLIFLSGFGAHSFYIGRPLRGLAFIMLNLACWGFLWFGTVGGTALAMAKEVEAGGAFLALSWLGIAVVGLAAGCLWFFDLFTLPKQIQNQAEKKARYLLAHLGVVVEKEATDG